MKLAAVVITYFPNVVETLDFIHRYLPHVDHLLIWDNTPRLEQDTHRLDLDINTFRVVRMGLGVNVGIGYALNQAVEWAKKNNFTHLLMMDQDSCFDSEEFHLYKKSVASNMKESNILIFSPRLSTEPIRCKEIEDVRFTITSGSILNLEASNVVGLFREDFFIDAIDTEYSIRGRSMGYRTVVVNDCALVQRFGEARRSSWGFISTDYSAFRTYHMVRNHIIVWKLFPKLFSFYDASKTYIFERVVKIILSEKDKKDKLIAIFKGIKDGLRVHIPYTKASS